MPGGKAADTIMPDHISLQIFSVLYPAQWLLKLIVNDYFCFLAPKQWSVLNQAVWAMAWRGMGGGKKSYSRGREGRVGRSLADFHTFFQFLLR